MNSDRLDESAVEHWQNVIPATDAVPWIEELINDRVTTARKTLERGRIDNVAMAGLIDMTGVCVLRTA